MIDIERQNTDPIYAEVVRIEKRERDGLDSYKRTQAQMRLQRLSLGIADSIYTQYIYEPMYNVINKVRGGNWLDAYNIIGSITPNQYLTPQMLTGFKIQIATYIVGEGEYTEYTGKQVDSNGNIII